MKMISPALVWMILAGVLTTVTAQSTPAYTRVTLDELHCATCAKKVSEKVVAVPGVSEMRYDLKTRTIFAMHKADRTPSPRALWEAIEQADHVPIRLDTPTASHTKKPRS